MHTPPPILLRLRLPRGTAGAELDATAGATVIRVTASAQRDGLQPADRLVSHDAASCSATSACEVSVLRDDATLVLALHAHGLWPSTAVGAPCFRLLKAAVRRDESGGLGLTMKGMRVCDLAGLALADNSIAVDDFVFAINGRRVEGGSLSAALAHAPPGMQVFTLLRRCAEHDLTDENVTSQTSSSSAGAEASATAEPTRRRTEPPPSRTAADAPLAAPPLAVEPEGAEPEATDREAFDATAASGAAADTSTASLDSIRPDEEVASAAALHPAAPATSTGAHDGGEPAAVAPAPFDPLDVARGVWCDLSPQASEEADALARLASPQRATAAHAYDENMGIWSDLPPSGSSKDHAVATRNSRGALLYNF